MRWNLPLLCLALLLAAPLRADPGDYRARGSLSLGEGQMEVRSCFAVWYERYRELQVYLFPFELTEQQAAVLRAHPSPYEVSGEGGFARFNLVFQEKEGPPAPADLQEGVLSFSRLGGKSHTASVPLDSTGPGGFAVGDGRLRLALEGSRPVMGEGGGGRPVASGGEVSPRLPLRATPPERRLASSHPPVGWGWDKRGSSGAGSFASSPAPGNAEGGG